ncbi:MAG: PfkB family carbohydrate kinase [Flavobacteriaceae bacterium]|nr:PfkB family carbohydrate kinase [Flavobacteriaceae bacterium]
MIRAKFVCFGEVLWDEFPAQKKIGGDPLNVALRLNSYGSNVEIIGSVGNDKMGKQILDLLKKNRLNERLIQISNKLKTGNVKVMINQKGSASYDIKFPRAWDHIDLTEDNKKTIKDSDIFIYGSLVGRDKNSRSTLYEWIKLATSKVLDVNLRFPYYQKEKIKEMMGKADFIKLQTKMLDLNKFDEQGLMEV